jgi:hypothetical protein
MKKLTLIALLLSMTSCFTIKEVVGEPVLMTAETGCCLITVYSNQVRYETDGYHTTEWYDNEVVKDEIINSYMEHCYHEHYKN